MPPAEDNPALAALREKYSSLPDLDCEELQATIKGFWKIRPLPEPDYSPSSGSVDN